MERVCAGGQRGTDHTAIKLLAQNLQNDPEVAAEIAGEFAERAVSLIQQVPEAASLASAAGTMLLGRPELARSVLDALGPKAASLAFALQLHDDRLRSGGGLRRGGVPERIERSLGAVPLLEACALGEPSEATRAFTGAMFAALTDDALREMPALQTAMAAALAQHWSFADEGARQKEEARLGEILACPQGRELLFGKNHSLGARSEMIALLRAHPEWNAATFAASESAWENPIILTERAQVRARDYLALRGDGAKILDGTHLENTIGFAAGQTPSNIPENETTAERDARELAYAEGRHSYYSGPPVSKIAERLREVGGENPQVAVVPIQFSSRETGPRDLVLFRVRDRESGEERFVDGAGLIYSSFEEWKQENDLPPGNMTYPAGGHLDRELESINTPATLDTVGEKVTAAVEGPALAVAGAVLIFGSDGILTPLALSIMGWSTYRAGERISWRYRHGGALDPFSDAGARADWFALGAGALSAVGLGSMALAGRLARSGSAMAPAAATAAGYLGVAATGTDALAALDSGYTLLAKWDELDGRQRAMLALSMGFWAAGTAKMVQASGGPRTALSPSAIRDRLLREAPREIQLFAELRGTLDPRRAARVRDFLAAHISDPAERVAMLERLARVAKHPQIRGAGDWVDFALKSGASADPAEAARQLRDRFGELSAALGYAEMYPGARIGIDADAGAVFRPGTNETYPSFDLEVTSRDGIRRYADVYTPSGELTTNAIGEAINHAAGKALWDAGVPLGSATVGPIDAVVIAPWPPRARATKGGELVVDRDGTTTLIGGDGRRIPRGNFFENYLEILRRGDTSTPDGAMRISSVVVLDPSGQVVRRFVRDPRTGWR